MIAALLTLTTGLALSLPGLPAAAHPAAEHADITIPAEDFQQVSMASGGGDLGEAMSLAVLPDRSVVHTSRDGTVRVTNPAGTTKVAGKLSVYSHDEEGLQGVAADPGFASNRYVWLYYSPRLTTPDGDAPASGTDFSAWKGHLNLSRFVLKADSTLDLASEKVVLTVDNDRGQCCHVGGDIDFDAQGNLYLTTGDDTNPFESGSYSPLDERTDRNPQFDAQRSSGNTNDLRGKLLRIHPEADGTYTIPDGNLFAPGTAKTRPEIYGMGFRNPFRMSVDKATGIVYLGDYGPDAGSTDPNRGPGGQVEFNRITEAGNYGWPYCTGTNTTAETYNEYTFPSGPSAATYDCAAPVNNSFRNTGLTTLPPAKAAWIKYGGDEGTPPEFGGGSESPMGGPVYRYDAGLESTVKFPAYLDGRYFAGELGRRWIKAIEVLDDGHPGQISAFPWTGTQVMDMAFGPDGALYVLDYGTGSDDQGLYRVEYLGGSNRSPVAKAAADRTSGPSPLAVTFSSAGSRDPEGGALTYAWTFGDGATSADPNPAHTYTDEGTFTATLTVTDPEGATGSADVIVTSGNTAPAVTLVTPEDGRLFSFGDTVPFEIRATDPEDGTIDCSKVTLTYLLGHDSHQHQITSRNGCTGTIAVPRDGEHDAAANIFGVFDASYTDSGGLVGHEQHFLQPRHRQAEHYGAMKGVELAGHGNAEGGKTAGYIDNGDWISFPRYSLGDARKMVARVASAGAGGTLEVRTGTADGPLLGSATVPITDDWNTFTDLTVPLSGAPAGTTTLFLVFKGPSGQGNLYDLDAFTFDTGENPSTSVEAESFTSNSGVQLADKAEASGGHTVGYINNGDWTGYSGIDTLGATAFSARVSSGGAGGTIEIRSGSATGMLLGTLTVPVTGSWETFQDVSTALSGTASGPLFLVFKGQGDGYLFDVDTFTLTRSTAVEAESFTSNSGVQLADKAEAGGGHTVGYINDGDWTGYAGIDTANARSFGARVSSGGAGGTIEVRSGSATGTLLGTLTVPVTGGFETFMDVSTALTGTASGPLFLVFKGPGTGFLFDVDTFTLTKGEEPPTGDPILVFSKTAGFRHDAIPAGIAAIKDLAKDGGYNVTATEDAGAFTTAGLARYKAVVFVSTTGDILNDDQQAALQSYVDGGGGYVGIHAASDAEYSWPYYKELVGAYFKGHPAIQSAVVVNEDRTHPATEHLDPTWTRTDEWYNFQANPRAGVHVLQSLDETSYTGGDMGDHPITWCHTMEQGRSFYTGLGHTVESYGDARFRELLVGGIRYATGAAPGECGTAQQGPSVAATTLPAAPDGTGGWYVSSTVLTVTAEAPAGVAKIEVSVDGGDWAVYTDPVSLSADGGHTVLYRATDRNGRTATGTAEVKRDATAPLTTAAFAAPGDDGWSKGAVPVTLEAADATSGIAGTEYSLDSGAWTPYTGPVNVTGDGSHTLAYRSTDKAGNTETQKAATIKIDATAPTLLVSGVADGGTYGDGEELRIIWEAADTTSGVKSLAGTLDGKAYQSGLLRPLHELDLGVHTVKVTAADAAGNETVQSVGFTVTTSSGDLGALVDRFAAADRLTQKAADKLQDRLFKLRDAEADGKKPKILKALNRFKEEVVDTKQVPDAEVRRILARDTDALIAKLS
ncbi:carbohydrate-binding protein [Actinocorallia longicatena]|uniref:Glucose/arabinose dehydrogenase n=1 Tax=Actinocorallia longicatena TaxID=111803 RepID=A0ABP6QL07_9ACTN